MNRKAMAWLVTSVVLVTLVAVVTGCGKQDTPAAGGNANANSNGANAAPPQKIKVGLILSKLTADAVEWDNHPWGYDSQLKIFPMMEDDAFELWPIIEPGSQDDKNLQVQLSSRFPFKKPIDGTDPAQLRECKVIVAWAIWHTPEELLKALASVVEKDGVGLFQGQGLGSHKYRIDAEHQVLLQLAGLAEGEFAWNPDWIDCAAVTEHPLLGGLSGQLNEHFKLSPNGTYGVLPEGATPLVRIVNPKEIRPFKSRLQNRDYIPYPIYLSSLGKGRIVGVQVGPNDPLTALQSATHGKFVVRCLKWCANEPLD